MNFSILHFSAKNKLQHVIHKNRTTKGVVVHFFFFVRHNTQLDRYEIFVSKINIGNIPLKFQSSSITKSEEKRIMAMTFEKTLSFLNK